MARTTGPVIAIGAITMGNEMLLNGKPFNWRVPIATAGAAAVFALVEKGDEKIALAFVYVALVTIIFSRTNPAVPSPAESVLKWWEGGSK